MPGFPNLIKLGTGRKGYLYFSNPARKRGVRAQGQVGVVILVHFPLFIFQIVRPKIRGSDVVVAGLSFIERESDDNRVREMFVGNCIDWMKKGRSRWPRPRSPFITDCVWLRVPEDYFRWEDNRSALPSVFLTASLREAGPYFEKYIVK
jgi:hypothetical protein